MFKKRDGTSGIRGQLYETKLISLIHFRTKFDDNIKDYNLATNVADIGTFDDICIRAKVKIKGGNKPVAVFIQAKHKEGEKVKQLTLNSKKHLAKWFSSYLSIRRLFKPSNKDVLFKGNFQEIECLFIMYTNAKADLNTKVFKSDFSQKLNSWIGTGDEGLQPSYKDEDILFLCEIIMKEQFAALAVQLAKFLSDNAKDSNKDGDKYISEDNDHNNGPIMSMYDDAVLVYHVILAQKVLNVSEIKCKYEKNEHRVATFQTDFFNNDDDFILLFKDTLFIEMLKNRKLKEQELYSLLSKLFIKPLDVKVLRSLIGNVVKFNDEKLKLEFVSKSMSEDLIRKLEKVDVLQSTVNKTINLAARDMLINRDFKVPVAFGNKDLRIRGKEDNIEPSMFIASVIDKLKNKMVDLINASQTENIVIIDESIGKEFLQLDAGLASTIGNILVSDENSKYMKFANNGELEDLAKRLYAEVQSAIPNLHDYKFHIKVKTFPKLTFDCDDDEDFELLKDQVTVLAELIGKLICKEDGSILPMNDTTVLRYHVLVAQKVIEVSEIQSLNEDDEHRLARFRQDFFESDEEFNNLFKKALYNEIVKIGNIDENEIDLTAKKILTSGSFKVPVAFGNKDLTIKIKSKTERRLDHLKSKIYELIKTKSNADKVVTIDELLEDSLKKPDGGIAGIVGNILVFEEDTKLMKFTDNWESLGEVSKRLFVKLQNEVENFHDYKFNIKVKTFPKLTFDCDDDENFEMLKDQVTVLAELMGKFICREGDSIMPMNDTVVLRYHGLVVQKAVEVSEIQSLNEDDEHRLASFRQGFFESDDEFDILFKKALYNEMLKIGKFDENEIDLTANFFLTSCKFKVPVAFGNKDLTITIKSKSERRLDHLQSKICELIKTKSNANKVVTIDESLKDGLKKPNGGIAGIVGNILVSEENTKLMKFTDNWESLGEVSKRLFAKLQNEVENLHEYKFDVKVKKFPKLSFRRDEDDENLAKDFLKKLVFFANQADEEVVEECLKKEIEDHQCRYVNNVRVTADAIFLQYHDLIQRWWKHETSYLTKQSKHYEEALAAIVDKPLLTIISKMYMKNIKNIADYTFNEKALNFLKLTDQPPATIFVTESIALTIAKMVQSLKKIDHYVFDLEYVLDLPANDFSTVCMELTQTNKNTRNKLNEINLIIIVCNNIDRKLGNYRKRLETIAKDLKNKRTVFVLKDTLVETIQTYFKANNIVTDEKCNLIQMSEESQKFILENANVMFQDVEVSLDSIIDETSMAFVEGEVLNKIMNNEPIVLGKSISNSNYERIKHLYIDRRVIRVDPQLRRMSRHFRSARYTDSIFETLNDIAEVALITANPGMGKSTLLTHVSLKTKELNPKVWIIRINLLIHSEKFRKWQENKTNIDYLETLKFFCEVLSEKQSETNNLSIELEEKNGVVTLKSCKADQTTVFELKMFLDYYKRKELIFLFDGFDEICPTYTNEVLTLLTTVKNYPRTCKRKKNIKKKRNHKMYITSRSYDKIISTLEQEFGNSYEIQHFSNDEQNEYLMNFWKSKLPLRDLSNKQYNNICSFMEFMSIAIESRQIKTVLFMNVCLNFLTYLQKEIDVCPESVVTTFNTLFSNCNRVKMKDSDTPLHLYLFAEYFQNQIKEESNIPNRWNLDINAFTVYDTFIETKLKIRFQEKNKINLYNPDNMIIYKNVRTEFLAIHHKLGAYAIFHENVQEIFTEKELSEIRETIDNIKEGTEKTGLIHSVANGFPQFLHMTFTEYFAVQYLCDILKTREDKHKSIWNFILFKNRRNIVRVVLDYKFKTDENLRTSLRDHKEIIIDFLLEHGKRILTCYPDDFSSYLDFKIRTTLQKAMDNEFMNFVDLLYNLKDELLTKEKDLNNRKFIHRPLPLRFFEQHNIDST